MIKPWKTVGDCEPRGGYSLLMRPHTSAPDIINCRCVAVELIDNNWLYGLIAFYATGFLAALFLRYWVFV